MFLKENNYIQDGKEKLLRTGVLFESLNALNTCVTERLNGVLQETTTRTQTKEPGQDLQNFMVKQELNEAHAQLDLERETHNRQLQAMD